LRLPGEAVPGWDRASVGGGRADFRAKLKAALSMDSIDSTQRLAAAVILLITGIVLYLVFGYKPF
jgi:hypothetical protein